MKPNETKQGKPCSKCSNYPRQGKGPWCAECVRQYKHAYYAKNRGRLLEQQRAYEAAHRKEALERTRAWRKRNPDKRKEQDYRYRIKNADKELQRSRRKRAKNLEKERARARSYYYRNKDKFLAHYHKRRARILSNGGWYTVAQWHALCAQYNYTCLKCNKRVPEITLTPDHVTPLSRGGSNDISNIQPLCNSCNSGKGARIIDYRRD